MAIFNLLRIFASNTRGATAIEYGLFAGLVALALGIGVGALSENVGALFDLILGETQSVDVGGDNSAN